MIDDAKEYTALAGNLWTLVDLTHKITLTTPSTHSDFDSLLNNCFSILDKIE